MTRSPENLDARPGCGKYVLAQLIQGADNFLGNVDSVLETVLLRRGELRDYLSGVVDDIKDTALVKLPTIPTDGLIGELISASVEAVKTKRVEEFKERLGIVVDIWARGKDYHGRILDIVQSFSTRHSTDELAKRFGLSRDDLSGHLETLKGTISKRFQHVLKK